MLARRAISLFYIATCSYQIGCVGFAKRFASPLRYRPLTIFMSSGTSPSRVQGLREYDILKLTSLFLYYRYLQGYESQILPMFSDRVEAYGVTSAATVNAFIADHKFDLTVLSIRADAQRSLAVVEYDGSSPFLSEVFRFDPSDNKIQSITTIFSDPTVQDASCGLPNRIHVCGGLESDASIAALKSVRLLKLGVEYLILDLTRDIEEQRKFLTEESYAFGKKGIDAISQAQASGRDAGVHYTFPFPIMINLAANCLSIDFMAYKDNDSGYTQRGTDIVYLDLYDDKVIKIDSVRHTLHQPEWVKQHFAGTG